MYIFFRLVLFIIHLVRKNMKCIICGKELLDDDEQFCKTCFEFMKAKYPNKKHFEKVLKWHKKHLKEMEEES